MANASLRQYEGKTECPWPLWLAIGAWGLSTFAGLATAFEMLVIGEELSTLGDRAHAFFKDFSEDDHFQGERLLGLATFWLSLLRPFLVSALLSGRRWGVIPIATVYLTYLLLDLALWSFLFVLAFCAADVYILLYCRRRICR